MQRFARPGFDLSGSAFGVDRHSKTLLTHIESEDAEESDPLLDGSAVGDDVVLHLDIPRGAAGAKRDAGTV